MKIALDTFVDNVAVLAVEACLLTDLASVIPGDHLYSMEDEEIYQIASEPPEVLEQRQRLSKQLEALKEAMKTCKKHVQLRTGKSIM